MTFTSTHKPVSVVTNSETKLNYAMPSSAVIVLDKQSTAKHQPYIAPQNAQFYDKVSEINRREVIRTLP